MVNSRIWTLIQRYVTGNIFPEERRELRYWMEQDPENKHLVQEVEKIWDLTPEEEYETDADNAWEHFRSRVMTSDQHKTTFNSLHGRSKNLVYIYRAVATILVILLAGYFAHAYINVSNTIAAKEPVIQLQEMTTGIGDNARIRFTDGSVVLLNSSSSLLYPNQFKENQREVYLEGEAYFSIAPNPDLPFIVHSQDAKIKVLGTEFNVRGWDDDESVHISVREGLVAVNSISENFGETEEVLLPRGTSTTVANGKAPTQPKEVNVEDYLLWTVGGLHFENVPFTQVVRDIERRFNVNVTSTPDGLEDVPYTGTFKFAELNEVLGVIAASLEIEYEREGNTVQFR